jgi:hypothetical protein
MNLPCSTGKWLVFLIFLGNSFAIQASPLNLTLADTPDFLIQLTTVAYDAGTDSLTATGTAANLDDDGTTESITGGSFTLTASIDASGALSSGTLSVGGTIASLGYNSGTLLTGDLTAFGFLDSGGDPLEFLFEVTGGDAAGLYPDTAGVILSNTGFDGDFTTNFQNNGDGSADIAPPVPLPAAMWLFISGLLGLSCAGMSRCRHQG